MSNEFTETHRETLDDLLNGLQGFRDQLTSGRDWVNITREDADAIDATIKEIDRLTTIQSNLNEQLVKCANQVASLKADIRKKDIVGKRMSE